mgnify:FL=1
MIECPMSFQVIMFETIHFLLLMYPLFRSKLLSVIFANRCLGNGAIFKQNSLSVMCNNL